MAIITSADVKVYNPQIRTAYAERVAKAINMFWERANGAFVVQDAAVPGEFVKESFWSFASGLVSRRIVSGTGATADATDVTIGQGENVAVKLHRKIGPATITDDALRKILSTPEEFSMMVGELAGDGVLEAMIADAITALVGALNRAPYLADRTGLSTKTLTREALAAGLTLMGDRASDVVCWVMHSKPYWDLIAQDMDPTLSTDTLIANVALYGGNPATLNRPVLVIDDANLVQDVTTDKYYTLGLTRGAVELTADTQLTDLLIERVGGKENIRTRVQGERDWTLQLKGFAWNTGAGGANPTAGALGTSTNWTASSTSAKDRAGVCIKTH